MQHAGPGTRTRCPKQPQPRGEGVLKAEGFQALDPRQQVGLLFLHQHGPAEGLLQGPAAAVAVPSRQHDLTRTGPLLQKCQVGLGQRRHIDQ